jgi:hypothetical protein
VAGCLVEVPTGIAVGTPGCPDWQPTRAKMSSPNMIPNRLLFLASSRKGEACLAPTKVFFFISIVWRGGDGTKSDKHGRGVRVIARQNFKGFMIEVSRISDPAT